MKSPLKTKNTQSKPKSIIQSKLSKPLQPLKNMSLSKLPQGQKKLTDLWASTPGSDLSESQIEAINAKLTANFSKPRHPKHKLTPTQRAELLKEAKATGPSEASRWFARQYGVTVLPNTVTKMLAAQGKAGVGAVKRGAPSKLVADEEKSLKAWVNQKIAQGISVTNDAVAAAATGIVAADSVRRHFLHGHGGDLSFNGRWACQWCKRNGLPILSEIPLNQGL